MTEKKDTEGIGGWLLLVAAGIVFSPIRIIDLVITLLNEIISTGT